MIWNIFVAYIKNMLLFSVLQLFIRFVEFLLIEESIFIVFVWIYMRPIHGLASQLGYECQKNMDEVRFPNIYILW